MGKKENVKMKHSESSTTEHISTDVMVAKAKVGLRFKCD